MSCPKCHKENVTSEYCPHCGAFVPPERRRSESDERLMNTVMNSDLKNLGCMGQLMMLIGGGLTGMMKSENPSVRTTGTILFFGIIIAVIILLIVAYNYISGLLH